MGYYVNISSIKHNGAIIKEANIEAAYLALCDLNSNPKYDMLKSGGSYGGEDNVNKSNQRPEGLDYHPARWFSWMSAHYHKNLKNLTEILEALGFTVTFDEKGNLIDLSYSDKTGNEDIFFCAIAPYIENDTEIVWNGEEGDKWKWSFQNGEMFTHSSKVMFTVKGQKVTIKQHLNSAEKVNKMIQDIMAQQYQGSSESK